MHKTRSSTLVPLDLELERTCRKIRKSKILGEHRMETMENLENIENVENNSRPLRDYATPLVEGIHMSINRPSIEANNFELKPSIIQMVQNSQFGGSPIEDPNLHLASFLEICATFKYNGVSDDAIRLRLFPFSLRDKAKIWLNSMARGSINSWNDLAQKFLAKYFPPSKTAKLRNDITSFAQLDSESIYEAWERYKEMLRKCPHHALPDWLIIQTFYNGLGGSLRTIIDAAAGGSLMSKPFDDAYELIEEMATNNFQWPSDRIQPKKVANIQDQEAISLLSNHVAALSRKFDNLSLGMNQLCSHENFEPHQLGNSSLETLEIMNFVGNRPNNPYSNTYNSGWRNHPNFSWNNQGNSNGNWNDNQQNSSGSWNNNNGQYNKGNFPPGFFLQNQGKEKKLTLEELVMNLGSQLQNHSSSIRNLETQLGQLASSLAKRPQGVLPSNTELNPKENSKELEKPSELGHDK